MAQTFHNASIPLKSYRTDQLAVASRRRGNPMPRCSGPNHGSSKGFTLLEVLVAIVVLSVALLGTASLTGSIIGYNQFADQVTAATTLAQGKIEELKNTDYVSIAGSTDTQSINSTTYSREWDVSDDSPAPDMKTITVTVGWNWKGAARDMVLRTIIGR